MIYGSGIAALGTIAVGIALAVSVSRLRSDVRARSLPPRRSPSRAQRASVRAQCDAGVVVDCNGWSLLVFSGQSAGLVGGMATLEVLIPILCVGPACSTRRK